MPEPTVITGSINTSDYAEREMEFPGQQAQETNLIALSAPPPGTIRRVNRHFKSLLPNLRISVRHTYDRIAADGTAIPGENVVIKFNMYDFKTDDRAEIKAIERSTEWGVNVYDADLWEKNSRTAQAENMAKQMQDNPELRAQVMNALKVKDTETFVPPEEGEKKKSKKAKE